MAEYIKPEFATLPPFSAWLASNIPAVYNNTMSYYEELTSLINWLETVVLPAVNSNAAGMAQLQQLFTELKNFVDNYFDNLDVQEEINNKLDAMVEDGTLQEIITTYIQANTAWCFNTVADMKSADNLIAGSYAQTLGFHTINDGGGALYYITDSGTANEMDVIAVDDLYANLITNGETNIKQLGAYGDNTHDDGDIINYAISLGHVVFIPTGTYVTDSVINIPVNTNIRGEDKYKSIISKTEVTTPNTVFSFTGNGSSSIEKIGIECNSVIDYGILSNVNISKVRLIDININYPLVAGIYTDRSFYLSTLDRVRVDHSSNYGIYLVPIDKNSYTNTSIDIIGCYTTECPNGFRIDGTYMNMENCANDGSSNTAYDLRGYIGSLVSCGSESYTSTYTFYGDHFTNATVINAQTFASYDKADSVHILTGNSSTWIFIGGKLAIKYRSDLSKGLGRFLEQSNDSHVKFIGTEVRGEFEKPSIILEGLEVNDYKGAVFNKGDILYTGYNDTNFGGEIGSQSIPSSAIYMGISDKPYDIESRRVTAKGTHTGDIYITKTPSKIGGMGWISDTEYAGTLTGGSYYKIPVVQSGATGEEPTRGLVLGEMFFDTTLGMPKWLTSVGRTQEDAIKITTTPTGDGTITFTTGGNTYSFDISAGLTLAQLYDLLVNAGIDDLVFRLGASSIICISKIHKNYQGPIFTISAGNTGGVFTDTVSTGGSTPHWTSLADMIPS